ncbi:hypothetical protein MKW92_016970, partial [Papaver armeniacum]
VIDEQLINLFISSDSIWQSYERFLKADNPIKYEDHTRSFIKEQNSYWKDVSPET